MKNILFLAHRIPFPPNKGDKIRSYHFLSYLTTIYNVYLGAFIDDPNDWQYTEKLDVKVTQTEEGTTVVVEAANPALERLGNWFAKLFKKNLDN